jgi:hypothetical protein
MLWHVIEHKQRTKGKIMIRVIRATLERLSSEEEEDSNMRIRGWQRLGCITGILE